jgi:hypothetical protein
MRGLQDLKNFNHTGTAYHRKREILSTGEMEEHKIFCICTQVTRLLLKIKITTFSDIARLPIKNYMRLLIYYWVNGKSYNIAYHYLVQSMRETALVR